MNTAGRTVRRDRAAKARARSDGQTLVEFALVLPLFIVLTLSVIEFAFVFNAILSINYASRDAALLAAEAGSGTGADCIILDAIEQDVRGPSDRSQIQQVVIFWADRNGVQIGSNAQVYVRTGATSGPNATTCTYPDGTVITVPYRLTQNGYPASARCNILAGCGSPHNGLDRVGVRISYVHTWKTPLNGVAGLGGSGYTFERSNVMVMEPIL